MPVISPKPPIAAQPLTPTTTSIPTKTEPASAASSRRFEFVGGGSSKFWQAAIAGNDIVVGWGKIGTAGQSQTKSFATPAEAAAELTKLVADKTKKGYSEVSAVVVGTDSHSTVSTTTTTTTTPTTPPTTPTTTPTATAPASDFDTLRPETRARIRALLATVLEPTVPVAPTNAPTVSPIAARASTLQKWSALDDDGKAEALKGNRDVIGATLHEEMDLATLTPAQRVVVDKIIALAEAQLPDNDDDGRDNTCRIGDPEPIVSVMINTAGEVLGVAVRFFQDGGAVPDSDGDDDNDNLSSHYPDEASAKKAGVDTGADVSWQTSEAMLFADTGKHLRDPDGVSWEWTGW